MRICGLLAILGSSCAPLFADTITLPAVADTTLIEIAPGNNLGGATFFNAGTSGNGTRNRALILFDVTAIPVGAVITDVSVSFEVVRQPASGLENSLFGLRRVFQPWREGSQVPESENSPGLGSPAGPDEATWLNRLSGGAWSQPGGEAGVDYSDTLGALASSGTTGETMSFESSPDLVSDVTSWINQPGANFGWMLVTESEEVMKTARSFASWESGFGPSLTIQYTPVPEPTGIAILLVGIVGGIYALRRASRS